MYHTCGLSVSSRPYYYHPFSPRVVSVSHLSAIISDSAASGHHSCKQCGGSYGHLQRHGGCPVANPPHPPGNGAEACCLCWQGAPRRSLQRWGPPGVPPPALPDGAPAGLSLSPVPREAPATAAPPSPCLDSEYRVSCRGVDSVICRYR